MVSVIFIGQTVIDWKTYIKAVTQSLGRSPIAGMDARWIQPKECMRDYIMTLKEIDNEGSDYNADAGVLLNHTSITMLVTATKTTSYEIMTKSHLTTTMAQSKHDDFYLSILTGTLNDWRIALLSCCSDLVSIDVRLFGSKVLEILERLELLQFMPSLQKVQMGDGTIRLIEKK